MATIGELIVKIGADAKGFTKVLNESSAQTNKWAKQTEKDFTRLGDKLSSIGQNMSLKVTAPIMAIGAACVKMAMDAVESENLFEVSMGNMADVARSWSVDLSKSLGLNQYELRKNVGMFYTMFESMQLNTDEAYKMSTGLTQLAYDMASFYNLKPEEAFEKLSAGITGETEPLKRLGILVDETTTKTWAYTHGIAMQGEALTQQQKVLARYGAIMEQTEKAQGDLARTLDSPTNKLRIQTERLKEMGITFGLKLIPVMERFLGVADKMLTWFENLSPETQDAIITLALFSAACGPVIAALGSIIGGVGKLIPLLGRLAIANTTVAAETAAVGTAATAASGGVITLSRSIAILAGEIGIALAAAGALAVALDKISPYVPGTSKYADRKISEIADDNTKADQWLEAKKAETPEGEPLIPGGEIKRQTTAWEKFKGFFRGYGDGGFTNQPSIFGEAGLEAAIPIDGSPRSLALWQRTGEMLGVGGGSASGGISTVNHTGTITVKGVSNTGELVGVAQILADHISQNDRRLPNRVSLIPI